MSVETEALVKQGLTLIEHGLFPERVHANLNAPALVEHALRRGEGWLTNRGAFVAVTTPQTGRCPKDKFIVDEPGSRDRIWWAKNDRLDPAAFDRLHEEVRTHLDAGEGIAVRLAYRVEIAAG